MGANGGRLKMAGDRSSAVQNLVLLYRVRACEAEWSMCGLAWTVNDQSITD